MAIDEQAVSRRQFEDYASEGHLAPRYSSNTRLLWSRPSKLKFMERGRWEDWRNEGGNIPYR